MLEVRNLKKSYDGEHLVLKDVSLNIKKGEIVVILGSSGCGKSTFLRCLNGLESIDSGEIILDGKLITQKDWGVVRQKVGMVFQSYELFWHMSILDNLLLSPLKVQKRQKEEVSKEARALLAKMGLESKIHSMPRELSGGQKQRVAIIRALCMHPEMLLLDEITASLDPEMVKEVLDIIQNLASEGMTMVIVTHELKFARRIADRIVFFDGSQILLDCDTEAFFNTEHPRIRKFLDNF